jgi:plastocyanin
MSVTRLRRLFILALVPLLACNGGTEPPGPPAQLGKASGDTQQGYFNNPLPMPYVVQVTDNNGRAVPGVQVTWAFVTGGGSLSPNPDTTDASGLASTVHTLGMAPTNVVSATVFGLPTVLFSATASAPPDSVGVDVKDNLFDQSSVVVHVNGTVKWTWVGANQHSVTFGSGTPTSPIQSTGTYSLSFATTGSFDYHCKVHSGMTGKVDVVN